MVGFDFIGFYGWLFFGVWNQVGRLGNFYELQFLLQKLNIQQWLFLIYNINFSFGKIRELMMIDYEMKMFQYVFYLFGFEKMSIELIIFEQRWILTGYFVLGILFFQQDYKLKFGIFVFFVKGLGICWVCSKYLDVVFVDREFRFFGFCCFLYRFQVVCVIGFQMD